MQCFVVEITRSLILGQTGLDAIPKDFKVEVPDDAIIYCCLQVAQRTNRVVRSA
jgi:hypothetical protein